MVFDGDQIDDVVAYYRQTAVTLAGVAADLADAGLGSWAGEIHRPLADAYATLTGALTVQLTGAATAADSVATMLSWGADIVVDTDATSGVALPDREYP